MLQWCYQMKCLMVGERPEITNGGWGAWSSWSRCSRTCGSGVAYAVRKCNRPPPSKGGSYCVGDRKRHKICATDVSFESALKQLSSKRSAEFTQTSTYATIAFPAGLSRELETFSRRKESYVIVLQKCVRLERKIAKKISRD